MRDLGAKFTIPVLAALPGTGVAGQFVCVNNVYYNWNTSTTAWVALGSAAPGGSDRQLQYNNGGAFGGISNYSLDASGNIKVTFNAATTTPSANQIVFEPDQIAPAGGHLIPRYKNESGAYQSLMTHVARCDFIMYNATQGSSTLNAWGGAAILGSAGTLTIRAVDETTLVGRSKRVGYVSAATAGQAAGVFGSVSYNAFHSLGGKLNGGFLAIFTWNCADAAAVAGAHMFVGMRSAITTPAVATSPATLTNQIGIAQVAGSTNLQVVYGGSAAQAVIDLGANFPAANTANVYELILYARPDVNNQVAYTVLNRTTGNTTSGVLTGVAGTALPANNILLGPIMWRSNNATALACAIDLHKIYVEHNWEKV